MQRDEAESLFPSHFQKSFVSVFFCQRADVQLVVVHLALHAGVFSLKLIKTTGGPCVSRLGCDVTSYLVHPQYDTTARESIENHIYTSHHHHVGDLVEQNVVSGALKSQLRLNYYGTVSVKTYK